MGGAISAAKNILNAPNLLRLFGFARLFPRFPVSEK
jgi:hypothetical protein